MKTHLFVLGLYAVLTVVSTCPQIRHMKQGIYSLSDQLFYAWVIERNSEALLDGSLHNFFDASIFYPYDNTLSFGDHLLGETITALPFYIWTGNPIFAQNALILISFVLSAYGVFIYVNYITRNIWVAFISGILFSFSHVRFNQYDHLNIVSTQWLPFIFYFLHKFLETGRRLNLVLFVVFYMLCSLFTVYYLFMVSLAIAAYAVLWAAVHKFSGIKGRLLSVAAGGAIGSLIIFPTFLPYFDFAKEFPQVKRVIHDNIVYSASLTSYLSTSPLSLVSRTLGFAQSEADGGLFPGYGLVFMVVGTLLVMKKITEKKTVSFFLSLSAAFFVLSLGPFLKVMPSFITSLPLPYYYLYYMFPPLQIMRVPARFAIFMQLFLVVAASLGLVLLFRRIKGTYKRSAVTAGLAAFIMLDTFSAPLPLTIVETKADFPAVYQWLKEQPVDTVVLELPIPVRDAYEGEVKQRVRHAFMENVSILDRDSVEAYRNYFSLLHGKRTINGYSAYAPPLYVEITEATKNFPDTRSLAAIKASGVDYVIVHMKQYSQKQREDMFIQLQTNPSISVVSQFGDDYVVRVL